MICQMTVMSNGDTLETATVGMEGASWISASIGAPSMPCETVVAIGGDAHALDIHDLDRQMKENAHFRDVLTQYSHALHADDRMHRLAHAGTAVRPMDS